MNLQPAFDGGKCFRTRVPSKGCELAPTAFLPVEPGLIRQTRRGRSGSTPPSAQTPPPELGAAQLHQSEIRSKERDARWRASESRTAKTMGLAVRLSPMTTWSM